MQHSVKLEGGKFARIRLARYIKGCKILKWKKISFREGSTYFDIHTDKTIHRQRLDKNLDRSYIFESLTNARIHNT